MPAPPRTDPLTHGNVRRPQKVWDHAFQKAPVLVIAIGSDEAMMDALTDYRRPLYDRAREMVIHPLTPAEVAEMLELPPADALDA